MGAIGGLLGTSGGASGTGFGGPTSANIQQPTTTGQVQGAYNGNQNALASQQALLNALQQQNGLANQSQVYNQLQGVANGTGPNPAQAQLAQATGQNVSNQAALMAGQRGASQNAGLLATQAAMQGANTQQQAVGQAATLQANQSLNAINSAGGIANTQAANQIGATTANTQAQQNEQQQLLSALANQNNANVSMQSNINSANAGLAQTGMQGQQGLIGGGLQGAGMALAAAAKGGMVKNYEDGGDVTPIVQTPVPTPPPAKSSGSSAASLAPLLAAAMANGGDADANIYNQAYSANATAPQATTATPGAQSSFGSFLQNWSKGTAGAKSTTSSTGIVTNPNASPLQQGASTFAQGIGKAASAPPSQAIGSTSAATEDYAQGGMTHDYRSGGNVKAKNPKEKAVVNGNSYANDKIPAVLSEGEVVIPRSVMQSKDPVRSSADFVQKVLARRKNRK